MAQSWGTALAAVGRPLLQRTASCFISPEAGVLAGSVAVGPTKPIGFGVVWQSAHADGCGRVRFARGEWKLPGENAPAAAPTWKFPQLADAGGCPFAVGG